MSVWTALFWGAISSASLYLGEALARPMRTAHHATGLVMGFGAGTLLSAVAYELVPESTLSQGFKVGVGVLVGALAYFVGDRLVDHGGGADRQKIGEPAPESSGAAMFVGALLDGVPESFILGATVAAGGSVSLAFVAAVFVSNIPQGVAGTTSLQAAGYSPRRIFWMWTALSVACALVAAAGFLLADHLPGGSVYAEAFAGGAVLTMLADSMMPEAFENGGDEVGLLTVLGFLVAGALTVLQ
jgi:zinc transporter, ZIP family